MDSREPLVSSLAESHPSCNRVIFPFLTGPLSRQLRDLEVEFDNEKRRHSETTNVLRKKERNVKELMIQMEEDQQNILMLQETLEKQSQKVSRPRH